MMRFTLCAAALALAIAARAHIVTPGAALAAEGTIKAHALAMHGAPKYGAEFTHFDYADPNAPKGGRARFAAIGTYDSLNPFILKGIPAAGVGQIHDTLMESSLDEAFTEYGLVAESIEVPADRSWVIFTLRPEARFSDNTPITADDVIYSFETLKTKGHPFYRAYYGSVAKVEKLGPHKVRFAFASGTNRELPLILGQLPVLSKAYWSRRTFEETTLEPPVASGPYLVDKVVPGRSITYRRNPDYWGKDLPVRRGFNNFDLIRYDYYRDGTVALEAFKAGEYDFRQENSSKNWATAYDFPAVRAGLVKVEEIPNELPTGMQGFVFNTRRPMFADRRVRHAISYAFDFEWSNKNLFYGAYTRTKSYFSNSELASRGLPEGEEKKILETYRGRVPDEVFEKPYEPPTTNEKQTIRDNLRTALTLLEEAGWTVRDGRLVNRETGRPMAFEILLDNPDFERIALPFAKNLERLGIRASVRTVDSAQYRNRMDNFDFDMTVEVIPQSLSPGNEQRDFWSSASAATAGGRNIIGVRDPVVDELVELVIAAPDRESLIARTRALDRVLLWGHYVIPHWHIRAFRVAYWDIFGRPKVNPKYGLALNAWWVDPNKAERLAEVRRRPTAATP